MRAWTSADKCRAYRRIQLLVDQLAARYFHNKFSTKTAAYTTPVSDENAFQLEKQTVHHIVFIMSVWDTGVDGVGRWAPQVSIISCRFALWDVVCQTKYCFSLKVKILRSPKNWAWLLYWCQMCPSVSCAHTSKYLTHPMRFKAKVVGFAIFFKTRLSMKHGGLLAVWVWSRKTSKTNQRQVWIGFVGRSSPCGPVLRRGNNRSWAGIIN